MKRDTAFYHTLRSFMAEYHAKSFRSMFQLALLNGGLVGPPRDGDGSIFCSELCARWLARLGLLEEPILRDVPHHLTCPGTLSHDFVYPTNVFDGELRVVHEEPDEDNYARGTLAVTLILAALLYATVSITVSRLD